MRDARICNNSRDVCKMWRELRSLRATNDSSENRQRCRWLRRLDVLQYHLTPDVSTHKVAQQFGTFQRLYTASSPRPYQRWVLSSSKYKLSTWHTSTLHSLNTSAKVVMFSLFLVCTSANKIIGTQKLVTWFSWHLLGGCDVGHRRIGQILGPICSPGSGQRINFFQLFQHGYNLFRH